MLLLELPLLRTRSRFQDIADSFTLTGVLINASCFPQPRQSLLRGHLLLPDGLLHDWDYRQVRIIKQLLS